MMCPEQQKEADRKRETKPTETLFIVNFDLGRVRERDIEKFFNPYGRIKRVEIKRNYAFVQVRMVFALLPLLSFAAQLSVQ